METPETRRSYETIRLLRSFYPDIIEHDRDPLQLFIGLLRYAAGNERKIHHLLDIGGHQGEKTGIGA